MAESLTRARDPEGANQSGLRDHNARAILSFVRRHGGMSSAEIARRSGLSAQTVSIIVRELERDGLLVRGEAIRSKGKVGKPQTPMQLNPDGVHSLGLNIGRRSSELVLVDFNGERIQEHVVTYPYPTVDGVLKFLGRAMGKVTETEPEKGWNIVGIGVTTPNQLWGWLEIVGAPHEVMDQWRTFDFPEAVAKLSGLEVHEENDATAACIAEHLLGNGREFSDFGYLFIGAFVGGGLVLDDKIISGRTKGAAAFGSIPMRGPDGKLSQLLSLASIHSLEKTLEEAGVDPNIIRKDPDDWSEIASFVSTWADVSGRHLAHASAIIASVVEIQAVLIDGAFPSDVRQLISDSARRHLDELDLDGVVKLKIDAGQVGRTARSIGAALLPIHSKYFLT